MLEIDDFRLLTIYTLSLLQKAKRMYDIVNQLVASIAFHF